MRHARDTHPLVLRAESARLSREAVESLAREIPSDAQAVDNLLEECIEGHFARAFTALSLAALHAGTGRGRPSPGRGRTSPPGPGCHRQARGARMQGDVVGALVGAVVDGRLSWQREAAALFLAAHWSRERSARSTPRRARAPDAHARARSARPRGGSPPGRRLGRARRRRALRPDRATARGKAAPDRSPNGRTGSWSSSARPCSRAWTTTTPRAPRTRRRAVPRVGRNDPCHCGSGKKYKRCCEARDQERLRDSSDVPGVTRAELRLHLEDHLDLERVRSLRAHELARLDPRRIDPSLHGIVLNQLIRYEEWDAVRELLRGGGSRPLRGARLRCRRRRASRRQARHGEALPRDGSCFQRRLAGLLRAAASRGHRGISGPRPDRGRGRERASTAAPWTSPSTSSAAPGPASASWRLAARPRSRTPGTARRCSRRWASRATGWTCRRSTRRKGWRTSGASEESDLFDELPPAREDAHAAGPSLRPDAGLERQTDDGIERKLADKDAELSRLRQELSDLHRKLDQRQETEPPHRPPALPRRRSRPSPRTLASPP